MNAGFVKELALFSHVDSKRKLKLRCFKGEQQLLLFFPREGASLMRAGVNLKKRRHHSETEAGGLFPPPPSRFRSVQARVESEQREAIQRFAEASAWFSEFRSAP